MPLRLGSHRLFLLLLLIGQHLAAEDPYFHADDAVGRLRFGEAVADIGAERMERDAPFTIPFGAGDLGPSEPAGALDPDPLRTHTHRARDAFLHRAAKRHPALELERDILRN